MQLLEGESRLYKVLFFVISEEFLLQQIQEVRKFLLFGYRI